MSDILSMLANTEFMIAILAAIAVFATVLTIGLPYLEGDRLASRLNSVANRRKELREKQKAELEQKTSGSIRPTPVGYMKETVEQFKLEKLLDAEEARARLARAGFRGQKPLVTFMFFRLIMPFVLLAAALAYFFFVLPEDSNTNMQKIVYSFAIGVAGFYTPNIFIENLVARRQEAIQKAFPDTLDLLLICVESGMSIEGAFNKVSEEIGQQSIEMAEEMSLTTAELSYLPDRRQAYENLANRTGLQGVKAVTTSLIQAERYGTPLATSLRVMAQENRDLRMQAAEKKAAALPAKLTVPMILFFLPVLFIVIMGPAVINGMDLK